MKNKPLFIISIIAEFGSRYFYSSFEEGEAVFSPRIKDAIPFDSFEEAETVCIGLDIPDYHIIILREGVLK